MSSGSHIIRELNTYEVIYETVSHDGILIVVYQLSLTSKKPLEVPIIDKSLRILQRRIPTLNMCIRKQGGKLFFWKMESSDIDFEICENTEPKVVSQKVADTSFNSHDGPLWRARLVTPAEHTTGSKFPYKYYMVFGFLHSITDGTSNARIFSQFSEILNGVVEEKSVSDDVIGEVCDGSWLEESFCKAEKKLTENDALRIEIENRVQSLKNRISPLNKIEPYSFNGTNESIFTFHSIDETSTTRLIKTFKANRVTFHSGFCAILDATIAQLLRKRGSLNDCKDIAAIHSISTRRYNPQNKAKFGFQVAVINSLVDSSECIQNNIPSHAEKVEKVMKDWLQDETYNLDIAIFNLKNRKQDSVESLYWINPDDASFEYATSNLGNLQIFWDEEKERHIQIDSIFRIAKLHTMGQCFLMHFHTFKNKLHFTFTYVTKYMSEEVASEFLHDFTENLKNPSIFKHRE